MVLKGADLLPALKCGDSRRELPTPLPHGSFTGSVGVIGHGQSTLKRCWNMKNKKVSEKAGFPPRFEKRGSQPARSVMREESEKTREEIRGLRTDLK